MEASDANRLIAMQIADLVDDAADPQAQVGDTEAKNRQKIK